MCAQCKGNAIFDRTTGKCPDTSIYTVDCAKIKTVNGKSYCESCPPGYNLVMGS